VPPAPERPEAPSAPAADAPTSGGYYYVPADGYPAYPTTGLPHHDTRPSNGDAVAGFVLGIVSFGLLLFSSGLSSVVSITCAIIGIVYGRKGKRRAESGQDLKHNDLAPAGFVVGIVALVFSILATAAWTLIIIFGDFDDVSSNAALVLIG
jgi:hypothetical protein